MDRSTVECWIPTTWVSGLNPAHPPGISTWGEKMWTHTHTAPAKTMHSFVSVWLGLDYYKLLLLVSRILQA